MFSKRTVTLGGVPIGGDAPVVVQSMTNTRTDDIEATLSQIRALATAGAEVVRVAVPDEAAAAAMAKLVAESPLPLIADVHFDHRLAVAALEAGAAGVRINPGNIGGDDGVHRVVEAAKERGAVIRVGVNSGSLQRDLRMLEEREPVRGPGGVGRTVLRSARADGFLEHQGVGEVVVGAGDDRCEPEAGDAGSVSVASGAYQGRHPVDGIAAERRRHRNPSRGRHRRHDQSVAHRRPGGGSQSRLGDTPLSRISGPVAPT